MSQDVRLRIRIADQAQFAAPTPQPLRIPDGGLSILSGGDDSIDNKRTFLAKEWSVSDDILNVSDPASFSIANDDGENSGKFQLGQRVEMEESDPDVADGAWTRCFTGRITSIETGSDVSGGSVIVVSCQDLGWHLTSSSGQPHLRIEGLTFDRMLQKLVDPSWGFGPVQASNKLNRTLKQGRQVITRDLNIQFKAVYPYVQIEVGQSVWDVMRVYAQREGVLVNVGAFGQLVLFRPNYSLATLYEGIEYHSSKNPLANNVIGRPTLKEVIDGVYNEVQCWTTILLSPKLGNKEDQNAGTYRETYRLDSNPLPFERRLTFSDTEAINRKMAKNRAIWKQQMERFNSWSYECELPTHSQVRDGVGSFLTSDQIIEVDDTVNGVQFGCYIQTVRRSRTIRDGTKSRLTLRRAQLLDPTLQQTVGGGAAKGKPKTSPAPAPSTP